MFKRKKIYKTVKEVVDDDWSFMPGYHEYPAAFIECMPIKQVTRDELYDLKCQVHYVPFSHYPYDIVAKKRYTEGEVGYDYAWRYVLTA